MDLVFQRIILVGNVAREMTRRTMKLQPSLCTFIAIVSAPARYTSGADRYPHLDRRAPSRWITQIDRQSVRESAFSAGGGTQRAVYHAFAPATLYMTIAMSLGRASRLSAASLLPPPPLSRRLSPCPVPYPLSNVLPKNKIRKPFQIFFLSAHLLGESI